MKRTMPQIIMLNHAAWVNHKRSELTAKRERDEETHTPIRKRKRGGKLEKDPFLPQVGKRMSECTTDEIFTYFNSHDPAFENFGKDLN